jgi:shikimate dehydrogenase
MSSENTIIWGVVGDPVKHSLSPLMHNAAFHHLGLPMEYRHFEVKPDDLESFLKKMKKDEVAGVNVTIPHKKAVCDFIDRRTEDVRQLGACNTVVSKGGVLIGHNTDATGYLLALEKYWALQDQVIDKDAPITKAVLLGAGGAAYAVAFALARFGVKKLVIVNRDEEKASDLVGLIEEHYKKCKVSAVSWEGFSDEPEKVLGDADWLVNTTPLGMTGSLPWPDLGFLTVLKSHTVVSDTVYTPRQTMLLEAAEKLGLKTHEGYHMLLHQGAQAFQIFTGKTPPVDVMEAALLTALD